MIPSSPLFVKYLRFLHRINCKLAELWKAAFVNYFPAETMSWNCGKCSGPGSLAERKSRNFSQPYEEPQFLIILQVYKFILSLSYSWTMYPVPNWFLTHSPLSPEVPHRYDKSSLSVFACLWSLIALTGLRNLLSYRIFWYRVRHEWEALPCSSGTWLLRRWRWGCACFRCRSVWWGPAGFLPARSLLPVLGLHKKCLHVWLSLSHTPSIDLRLLLTFFDSCIHLSYSLKFFCRIFYDMIRTWMTLFVPSLPFRITFRILRKYHQNNLFFRPLFLLLCRLLGHACRCRREFRNGIRRQCAPAPLL